MPINYWKVSSFTRMQDTVPLDSPIIRNWEIIICWVKNNRQKWRNKLLKQEGSKLKAELVTRIQSSVSPSNKGVWKGLFPPNEVRLNCLRRTYGNFWVLLREEMGAQLDWRMGGNQKGKSERKRRLYMIGAALCSRRAPHMLLPLLGKPSGPILALLKEPHSSFRAQPRDHSLPLGSLSWPLHLGEMPLPCVSSPPAMSVIAPVLCCPWRSPLNEGSCVVLAPTPTITGTWYSVNNQIDVKWLLLRDKMSWKPGNKS